MNNLIARKFRWVVAAFMVMALGCVMANELAIYKVRPIKFSHKIHVTQEKMECGECHVKAAEGDEAGMPGMGACQLCHSSEEDINTKLKPFAPDNKLMWTTVTKLGEDLKFSHQNHLNKNVSCQDCHGKVAESEAVSEKFKVSKDDCQTCHAAKQASSECSTCHAEVNDDWKPASHARAWEKAHGQVARSGLVPPYENRCSMCHEDSDCSTCHQAQEPSSHTNSFRTTTHGINARMDRDACLTCHRTDSCDRCHRETTPRNHRGGWGEPRDNHCYTCHLPVQNEGCFTCHKVEAGHLQAPPLPNNVTHDSATDRACRDCHTSLGTLTHPDNGDSCRNCHR
jgi:hypothetical protein